MLALETRIRARAKQLDPIRGARTALSLPFYVLGAVAGAGWFLLTWVWAAISVGFADLGRRDAERR